MQQSVSRTVLRLTATLVVIFAGTVARAQTAEPIYSFQGGRVGDPYDGAAPEAPLTLGRDGTFYGTTSLGGTDALCNDGDGDSLTCGTVFQLKPPTENGKPWTESIIQNFGPDQPGGYFPWGSGLVLDAAGNLYGINPYAGIGNCGGLDYFPCGAVFELIRPEDGEGLWTWNIVHVFQPKNDGNYPWPGGLVFDSAGNLYGTTAEGGIGDLDGGTVFRLAPPASGSGPWTETVLYSFCPKPNCADGVSPEASIVMDGKGDLFSTTLYGGTGSCESGCGTVFELSPPRTGGGSWTETALYSFQGGSDGFYPNGVIFGRDGSLYGTTQQGGGDDCAQNIWPTCGVIFRLAPPATKGGTWTESVLYRFRGGSDGSYPLGNLVSDAQGRLYGTTEHGAGVCAPRGCGTVFGLAQRDGTWEEKTIYRFGSHAALFDYDIPVGYAPQAGLIIGKDGHLYGTASAGGLSGGASNCAGGNENFPCGTVFEIIK